MEGNKKLHENVKRRLELLKMFYPLDKNAKQKWEKDIPSFSQVSYLEHFNRVK